MAVGLDREIIQPGDAATLKVEFLSPNRQGGFRHELVVRFADERDPITINLFGTVSAWIQSNVSLLEFGGTFPGEASRRSLRLQVRESWPEEQRQIKSLMPYTRIEAVAAEDDGKAVNYTIIFQPPMGVESKECEGDLVVGWAGHDDRGFKLPCKGKVVAEWVSDPPQVVLGKVSSKRPPAFTVRLRSQRYAEEICRRDYKVIAQPGELLEASSTWDSDVWRVSASVREEGLLRSGVKSAALCVTASDGKVVFRVPVYWETEP